MNSLRFQLSSLYHTNINGLRLLHIEQVLRSAVLDSTASMLRQKSRRSHSSSFAILKTWTLDNLQNYLHLLPAKSQSLELADPSSGSENTCEVVELPLLQLQMQPPPFAISRVRSCEYKLLVQDD